MNYIIVILEYEIEYIVIIFCNVVYIWSNVVKWYDNNHNWN